MATATITKRVVDATQPAASDQFLWDTEVSGFGLKVTPAGSKVYVFQYRIARPGEAERTPAKRYTIGKHGRLTPDQARKRAKELAALVEQGIDPRQRDLNAVAAEDEEKRISAENARLEMELQFDRIADLWLDHYENVKARRPSSIRQAKGVVDNHLKPRLSGRPIPHISKEDMRNVLNAVPTTQKATRRAVYAYASVLFGWAVEEDYISHSPLTGLTKPEAVIARERVLSETELALVWQATYALSDPFSTFYRLLILTGQRREEVASLSWSELDRSASMWTIPSQRTKNDVVHLVPLSSQAIAELDALADSHEWPQRGFVLSTTGKSPISGFSRVHRRLIATTVNERDGEQMSKWRIHDLRRTLATGLQKLGVRFEVTEAVLNHISGAKGGLAGVYQRHDWKEEKRSALEAWARKVSALNDPAPAKVVPLRRAVRGKDAG